MPEFLCECASKSKNGSIWIIVMPAASKMTRPIRRPEIINPVRRENISPAQSRPGSIEIALPNGTRISVDASVNEKALSRVLRAMNGLS